MGSPPTNPRQRRSILFLGANAPRNTQPSERTSQPGLRVSRGAELTANAEVPTVTGASRLPGMARSSAQIRTLNNRGKGLEGVLT